MRMFSVYCRYKQLVEKEKNMTEYMIVIAVIALVVLGKGLLETLKY